MYVWYANCLHGVYVPIRNGTGMTYVLPEYRYRSRYSTEHTYRSTASRSTGTTTVLPVVQVVERSTTTHYGTVQYCSVCVGELSGTHY